MDIRSLTPELQKLAINELNEDSNEISTNILLLRKWLSQQPHLAHINISDQRLLSFLRGCKFSVERSKEKLDKYFTMKNIAPDLFYNRDPLSPAIQNILKLGVSLPLTKIDGTTGPRIYWIRLGAFDPSKYSLFEIIKVSFMLTDILMKEDDNLIVAGQKLIVDLKGISLTILSQFTPSLAKKVTTAIEKVYPIRQKGIHLINTLKGIEAGFNLFKSFLGEKTKNRIYVHNLDEESIYEHIPKNIVPKDLGGDGSSTQELIDYWKKMIESHREWFLKEEKNRTVEEKRPVKLKTDNIFGIDGTFKKIEID